MESRPCGIRLALVVFLAGLTGQSQAQIEVTPDALRARGVLFYAPFEGTAKAAFATGQAEPWVARDVLYAPGVHGQAVQLLAKAARTVKMPDGTTRKYMNAESMLVYEARGNVYPRRGTLAFWVLSPWDASDQNLLTGSNLSGPTVIGISARDVYPSFFDMPRWKAFFGCLFGGECVRGSLARFGSLGQKIIPRWKKDEWHHVAVTWDDRRGFAVYHNGELLDKFEGDIEWDMLEPDTIALGSWPLRWGDLWPVNAEYVFDELLILARPLSADEVAKVKDGDYVGLRPMTAADWPDETDKRRRRTGLDAAGNRPMIRATADGARETVRQVAVEDVQMKFHRAFALVDGAVGSSVQFQDGGLPFDTPAKFRFHRPSRVNHLVAVMGESKGSRILEEGNAIPDGRSHISLPDRERADFGIFFSGNSEAKEVMFFERQPGVSSAAGGTVFEIGGMIDCGQFPGADRVLLTSLNPCDRPALYAIPGDRGALTRKAMAHTFIVLPGADKDRFVDGLRLVLRLKPAKTQFGGVIRIHDPQIDGRLALEMDYAFEWPSAGTAFPLDISMAAPGLIIPAGGHLVLSVTLDAECEVECGKGSGSRVEIVEGDAGRIGHEFALAQIRCLYPSFGRRLNQNRFLQAGEEKEKNPIWRGLTLAEKYDPENELVKSWWGWSRLRPWPAYDFSDLDNPPRRTGPKWAVYTREAVRSMQATLHWWLDHRTNADGYIVGAGNQWNDITDFYSTFVTLGATASDSRLLDALERYQDAHWNSGRMSGGYTVSFTDLTHSLEEATEIQPNLDLLRPGVPRHFYRDLLTAGNLPKWMGKNASGHTHFRSNFFNAARLLPTGVQGRDFCACESATTPGRYVCWYNGHPALAKLLTDYADSWLADILRETKTKPAGVIPSAIQFETDELFADYGAKALTLDMLMSAYSLTGDAKYLEPVKILLTRKGEVSDAKWALTHSLNFVHYRLLTGDASFDETLRLIGAEAYQNFGKDAFFQRGFEQVEGQALCRWVVDFREDDLIEMLKYVIRNNRRGFLPYTVTDPPTDRVYPWGREVLQVAMLGGRVFYFRASMPAPSAAFLWTGTDSDVASLVFERKPTSLRMLVHNFKPTPVQAGLRVLQLPEGRYRLATALDLNSDRKPDSEPQSREVELRRFTPLLLTLPARQTLWVELSLLAARPKALRPDLAVTLAKPVGSDGRLVAHVHNLGCAAATNVVVRLVAADGRKLAESTLGDVPGVTAFEPQTKEVQFSLPPGVKAEECALVADPDDTLDEVNESNNRCELAHGVPPPAETPPKK